MPMLSAECWHIYLRGLVLGSQDGVSSPVVAGGVLLLSGIKYQVSTALPPPARPRPPPRPRPRPTATVAGCYRA
eukprot:scaffold1640_cov111-Isochrysis_galbana.AAC.15